MISLRLRDDTCSVSISYCFGLPNMSSSAARYRALSARDAPQDPHHDSDHNDTVSLNESSETVGGNGQLSWLGKATQRVAFWPPPTTSVKSSPLEQDLVRRLDIFLMTFGCISQGECHAMRTIPHRSDRLSSSNKVSNGVTEI